MEGKSTFKYHISSFAIHVFSITAALAVATLTPKSEAPVLMEFTTMDASQAAPSAQMTETQVSKGPSIKEETQFDQDAVESKLVEKAAKDEDVVTVQKPPQPLPTKKEVAKSLPQKTVKTEVPKIENTQQAEPKITVHKMTPAKAAVVASEEGDEKFLAPALETDEVEKMVKEDLHEKTAQKFNEDSIRDDLDKVDEEQSVKVAALKTELDSETDNFLSEQEQDISELHNQKQKADKELKNKAEKMRAEDSAKVAAARQAEEKAAADEAAAAAAFAAQQKAMQEKAAQQANGQGNGAGQGEQLDGSAFGVSGPVRQLEDLRQMPGNKKPQYDSEDRLKGRQGEIAFLAFVSKQGLITDVKLIKATGHRSLDGKTLSAIRNWKFYPGQEGWVEIPFKWDLKGGPQEMPATLRRKISQR